MVRYEKGTKIVCPHCDHEISEALRDIPTHERISSKPWRGLKPNTSMQCPECDYPYHDRMRGSRKAVLHTESGWR